MIDINSLVKTVPEIQIIITKNFKKRRKEHKITQKELSYRSGVPVPSIKRFEQKGDISLASLIKIANVLELENDLITLFTKP
ncbi:MAG: helix-turn-helix transcriptional regulator, partial [Spirochaetaceae bacterium]|nr:helix-turn-helix transcriptional regulator [Spirochaetaceae bacterium]